jgi:2-oxoglutarate dehydrogenase E1 component
LRYIYIHNKEKWKLGELIAYLEKVYCGKIGYEYEHLSSWEERCWIRSRIENYEEFKPTP